MAEKEKVGRHWNYRVMRTKQQAPDGRVDETLAIHEVHYGEDGEPDGWTLPVGPLTMGLDGEAADIADLKWCLERMAEALDKPILDEEELESNIPIEERIPHYGVSNP